MSVASPTRPNIVRADTLDLQDEEHPTAAEHTKPNPLQPNGLAPHLAAQVHHVIEERHSEEQSLAEAWNITDNLVEQPEAIEQAQSSNTQATESNGTSQEEEDGESGDQDGDADADDDMMDRISSSPSIDDEDIDFEFVYALHTFVATVEGQANATKGDTMVLLDDSNSYWWLVRVVKDSSIGYLPAEHIETPTERLARLNKHRNIDLSATMLSDNSEKSRNPLKKAMRRRNAKTVQFAAPTYVEASDYDYSSDDEDNMIDPYGEALQSGKGAQNDDEEEPEEQKAESKDPASESRSSTSSNRASFDREQAATAAQALAAAGIGGDDDAAQPKTVDKTGEYDYLQSDLDRKPNVTVEAAPLKSRKPRNTDSFLKDDTIETRKITLTPGLLRDENASLKSPTEEQQPKRSNSLEPLTKTPSPAEPAKKEVKDKKEPKKGGLLSGLFKSKKKDKKTKDDASDYSDGEKLSTELGRDSPRISPLPSGTNSPIDRNTMAFPGPGKRTVSEEDVRDPPRDSNNAFVAELPGSEVAYEMATGQESSISETPRQDTNDGTSTPVPQEKPSALSNALSPITNVLKTSDKDPKPRKAKRAKQRVQLDDFDSPQDEREQNPLSDDENDRLSESPVEISSKSFMHGTESIHIPMPDVDEHSDNNNNAPASLSSSPSLIDHPDSSRESEVRTPEDNDPTPTTRSPQPTPKSQSQSQQSTDRDQPTNLSNESTTTSSSTPPSSNDTSPITTQQQQPWDHTSLRAWLEDGSEVRDMLVMIHDKTGVTPAPADHPLMAGLFVEQRKGVQSMMGELDGLLGSYLQRKGVQF
ncbi:unnamed protein product [Zymoseptoria tritici ST99CH_1A5]|uniref:SH3 domain-containing protein n=2 Tax=Zymoseptoria tritici TaxID=1047171 RepID=A0A2H1FYR3_ZYMTR|nr:unnamed protein product [Zymoseptoria tritici ST99CH_1E4]SMY21608.1 unnamed protein product [Zymoseptoria tritici ST99CH_1A5]